MRQQFTPVQLCSYFGINLPQEVYGLTTKEAVKAKLDDIKERVNKIFKQRAMELHPDRNNGNDEQFKELSNMRDQVMELSIIHPPRPPLQSQMRVHVRVYMPSSYTSNNTTGTDPFSIWSAFDW